ncbi:hypothetical protein PspLS_02636 [Pyricularia sp. CBS 133598]|nr:hypothetical protein PspLS_02636 [Pyricularia sp. CBS 133598]
MSEQFVLAAKRGFRQIPGVVVSAGLMDRTVKVRVGGRIYNNVIKKHFNRPKTHLVHDPNNSCLTGDVVEISPGWPTSRHKRHVIVSILAAATTPAESRPPVPSLEERIAEAQVKRAAKVERRAAIEAETQAKWAAAKEEKRLRKLKKEGKLPQAEEQVAKEAAETQSS